MPTRSPHFQSAKVFRHKKIWILLAGIAGAALIFFIKLKVNSQAPSSEASEDVNESFARIQLEKSVEGQERSTQPKTGPFMGLDSHMAPTPFSDAELIGRLKDFLGRFSSGDSVQSHEMESFENRLALAIRASAHARAQVEGLYREMRSNKSMERDLLKNMLYLSEDGRSIVANEARDIWNSKDLKLFPEMMEIFFNLPENVPQDIFKYAIQQIGMGQDLRTTVAALNLIGTLERDVSAEAVQLRQTALDQLRKVANGSAEELIRVLAVQKIYRLNSPEASANIAIEYLTSSANTRLIIETLNSINSGDVQLSPSLNTTLRTVLNRPGASPEEGALYRAMITSNNQFSSPSFSTLR